MVTRWLDFPCMDIANLILFPGDGCLPPVQCAGASSLLELAEACVLSSTPAEESLGESLQHIISVHVVAGDCTLSSFPNEPRSSYHPKLDALKCKSLGIHTSTLHLKARCFNYIVIVAIDKAILRLLPSPPKQKKHMEEKDGGNEFAAPLLWLLELSCRIVVLKPTDPQTYDL